MSAIQTAGIVPCYFDAARALSFVSRDILHGGVRRAAHGPGKMRGRPKLWLMSDERLPDLLAILRRMPPGSGVIIRHYSLDPAERLRLFRQVRVVAKARRMVILLGGDSGLARRWGADGAHLSGKSGRGHGRDGKHDGMANRPITNRPIANRPITNRQGTKALCSMGVHNGREAALARRLGVDLALISPLFATRSHPGQAPLRGFRAAQIAGQVRPGTAAALGGMNARRWRGLARRFPAGWAAIDAWRTGVTAAAVS